MPVLLLQCVALVCTNMPTSIEIRIMGLAKMLATNVVFARLFMSLLQRSGIPCEIQCEPHKISSR